VAARSRGCGPELAGVLDRLAAEPAPLTLNDPRTGAAQTYHLTRGAFAEEIRRRLYAPATRITVPLVIHQAAQGDYGPLVEAVARGNGGPTIAEGLYLSVTCAEDVPFIDPAMAERLAAAPCSGCIGSRNNAGPARSGRAPASRRSSGDPVESKAPTLILSGDRDPITPPRLGDEVLRHLHQRTAPRDPPGCACPDGYRADELSRRVMLSFLREPSRPGPPGRLLEGDCGHRRSCYGLLDRPDESCPEFVHLHLHTEYKPAGRGLPTSTSWWSRRPSMGMKAMAVTDHGNMFGAVAFLRRGHARGIKPILGCEVYVAPGSRHDKDGRRHPGGRTTT
jgi:hypothetical protein